MADSKGVDTLAINTVRLLSADMVQKANSGHPGMPMGMAPAAHVLWTKVMKYAPHSPKWFNRDRFVLSNGHGCALLYSLLHLTGFKGVTMQDLQQFRQLGSKTPGHPEAGITEGVEVTTGPLGQGFANAVGLAIGEAHLAAVFNKPNFPMIDHYTYVFCGDGCLQEGISGEAASLAGHLKLGKLIVIYDDNKVTIDGPTDLSFSEDVPKRFEAYGWHTVTVNDGDHDLAGIQAALEAAKKVTDKPSIISLKTTIGFGAKKQGTEEVHGSPLGNEELKAVKTKFGFDPTKSFVVPAEVAAVYGAQAAVGDNLVKQWNSLLEGYAKQHPELAAELNRRISGQLPANWRNALPAYKPGDKADATRNLSYTVLNNLCNVIPEIVGGSADLTPSTKTQIKSSKDFLPKTPEGRYLRFGVREHAMVAIGNGLAAHGGLIPFTSTFLNFLSYCFPSVRLAALSHHQHILIMTHDSIGLGEDGPTHQPVEILPLCRATPNCHLIRPADGKETAGAYAVAMENTRGPTVLALSRQNLPHLAHSNADSVALGGYVLEEIGEGKTADVVLVASGSEVPVALDGARKLVADSKSGVTRVRVVSMPSTTLFDKQPVTYRRSILPPGVPIVSIEASGTYGWERYAHLNIGMTTFGASAPLEAVMSHFGFTAEKVHSRVSTWLEAAKKEAAALNQAPFRALPTQLGL